MKEDVFVIIGKEISWNFHIHVKALKCNFMRKPVKAYFKWTTSGEPSICMKSYLGSKWSHSKQFFWSFFNCHPVNLTFSYNLLLWNVLKSYVWYRRNKTFFICSSQLSHEILFQAWPRSSMTRIEGVQIQGQRRNIEIDKTGCKG